MLFYIAAGQGVMLNAQTQFDVKLWEQGLPNSNGKDNLPEQMDKGIYTPEVKVFLPEKSKATGRAVLACPGGAYCFIALEHEGYNWAPYFNDMGIALIVLKYRLPFGHPEVPFSDAEEAMRLIRRNAKQWNINPNDVGIMGSSAGGHLASTIAVKAPLDARPDFQILFYPVVTMQKDQTHNGSLFALVGDNPSADDQHRYSNERHIRRHVVPPTILLLSGDDLVVPISNSINYYNALASAEIPAAMHIYPSGGHGWGYNDSFIYHEQMLYDLKTWLEHKEAPNHDAIRVACVGNSITDGYGVSFADENGYPALLGKKLGKGYHVKNFGVSGHSMLNKSECPYMRNDAYQWCKDFNPNIVVIKLGTNDSKAINWQYKDEFMTDVQQMIDELKALPAHPEIYLAYPAKAMTSNFEISDSVIVNDIIPMIRKIAKKNKLKTIDLHSIFEGHSDWFIPDGIHPNGQGAEAIAEEVKKAILKN